MLLLCCYGLAGIQYFRQALLLSANHIMGLVLCLLHRSCMYIRFFHMIHVLYFHYKCREVGRILKLGGPKKNFRGEAFFSEIFLTFYIEILKYRGILSPKTSFEGQSRAFRTYIYYLYNFRGKEWQNIGAAMAPLAPL